jgi:hypothetical protein
VAGPDASRTPALSRCRDGRVALTHSPGCLHSLPRVSALTPPGVRLITWTKLAVCHQLEGCFDCKKINALKSVVNPTRRFDGVRRQLGLVPTGEGQVVGLCTLNQVDP